MIESTPISVRISPQNFPVENVSGIGRIVISDKLYYLDIGSSKISLGELPDGSFSDGEAVRYFISNNKITITPLSLLEPPSKEITSSQSLQKISDSLNLSSSLNFNESIDNNTKSRIICDFFQNTTIPSGIYLFSSPDEIFSLLKEGDIRNIPIKKILNLFANSTEVTLQIENILNGKSLKITQLESADLGRIITELINSFKSYSMKSIPVAFFEEFFTDKNFLPTSILVELDKALCDIEKNLQMVESKLANIPQNIFLQWLKVVLNYSDRVPPYEIVRTAPLYDAESLIGELEKVFQFVSTLKDNELYKKTADILQQFLTGVVPEKSDFLYKYMESIGFTFEHQLANENKVSLENLKSALLTIYGLLTQKVQNVDYKKLGNFLDKDQLTKGIFEILTKYKEIEDLFKSKYSKYGLFLQQSNLSDLSDKSDFFYYNSSFIEESLTKDITKLTEVILKIFNKLSEIIKNSKEFNIPLKPSELSLVQETLEKAEKIYKILSSRREENLLENLFIEKRSEISTDVSLKQYSITTYNQTIKITEGLIDKIESFQLLAQKLQGHNGTSQVIVLPVKIGDEWTEVNIQLFNCKQKNKGRKSSKFLVSIEIAPRSLGEIHIHLDYNQNKKLQLCAEFEKDETYNWFSKHKEELNETLRGYGVLLLSLDFRKMSSHTSENKKSYFTISKSGTIDIKV